jgi:hypothetical protein
MTPLPGARFVAAPFFHFDIDWPARLSLGAGVESTAEGPVARPPWRPASADELVALVLDPTRPGAREELPGCLCLFVVPVHLRSGFWDLLAQARKDGEISPDRFSAFAAEVARFLAFKQLPLPAGAVFDLVVTRPGPTTRLATAALWGLINLGEDTASVVFLNVPAGEIPAADYPPVRLQLVPGEGVRVPAGILLGTDWFERDQPDVLLLIRLPGAGGGEAPGGQGPFVSEKSS